MIHDLHRISGASLLDCLHRDKLFFRPVLYDSLVSPEGGGVPSGDGYDCFGRSDIALICLQYTGNSTVRLRFILGIHNGPCNQ